MSVIKWWVRIGVIGMLPQRRIACCPFLGRSRMRSIYAARLAAVVAVCCVFCMAGLISPRIALGASKLFSSREIDPSFIEIKRTVHRFRHWSWNGIFPLYGERTPDPHILYTPVFHFLPEVQVQLGDAEARYQGFDINPWFRDSSSEAIMAVEVGAQVFEFSIDVPRSESDSALAISGVDVVSIPAEGKLLFFSALRVEYPYLIEIPLPLTKSRPAVLHSRESV